MDAETERDLWYDNCQTALREVARLRAKYIACRRKSMQRTAQLSLLFDEIKWFLDNPSDYPGGQDDDGIRLAFFKLTGWKPDWDSSDYTKKTPPLRS